MRPSDRTIRDELRREAAKVSIPKDMWQNISHQLDADAAKRVRRRRMSNVVEQWRPAVILAVAAGFFWFALIPSLPSMDRGPGDAEQKAMVSPSGKTESTVMPTRTPVGRELHDPGAPSKMTSAASDTTSPLGHFPTVPQ